MSDEPTPITITVTVPNDDVAWQLAQFCKRIGWSACHELTEAHLPEDERKHRAYQMLSGLDAIAAGLAEAGVRPR